MDTKYEYMFSVITVCYNAESDIEKTIKSVLDQSNKNYEYLIVDGKSEDKTISIAQKYYDNFQGRMKIFSEKDNGLYDAMNKGAEMANGSYLVFINAGDELCTNILQEISDFVEKNKPENDSIIYGDSFSFYFYDGEFTTKLKKAYPEITLKTLKKGMGVVHQSMFTSKSLFCKIGNFNINYTIGADWDFLIRCVAAHAKLYYLDKPICIFGTDGISSGVYNFQRHFIRKKNHLYRFIDIEFFIDMLNIKTTIQLIIGKKRYQKLRYLKNKMVRTY